MANSIFANSIESLSFLNSGEEQERANTRGGHRSVQNSSMSLSGLQSVNESFTGTILSV